MVPSDTGAAFTISTPPIFTSARAAQEFAVSALAQAEAQAMAIAISRDFDWIIPFLLSGKHVFPSEPALSLR